MSLTRRTGKILTMVVSMAVMPVMAAPPAQLLAPTGLSADTTRCGQVTLRWNPVAGARGYHLIVMSGGVGSESDFPGTSINYPEMKPGLHSFKVKALGIIGQTRDSDFSASLDFEVKECAAACTEAPKVTLCLMPNMIWPPNHKLVPVNLSGTIMQKPGCILSGASYKLQDEYGANQAGIINVGPNGGAFSATVYVEAWRNGTDMDGRMYTFTADASNQAGKGVSLPAIAIVPHDQR